MAAKGRDHTVRLSHENWRALNDIRGRYGTFNAAVDLLLKLHEEHLSKSEEGGSASESVKG